MGGGGIVQIMFVCLFYLYSMFVCTHLDQLSLCILEETAPAGWLIVELVLALLGVLIFGYFIAKYLLGKFFRYCKLLFATTFRVDMLLHQHDCINFGKRGIVWKHQPRTQSILLCPWYEVGETQHLSIFTCSFHTISSLLSFYLF